MTTPILSICVPSRNRQRYFRETIAFLIGNPRADVEFVFADNSDDPSLMNGFMAGIADSRIRYLPSADTVLPMQDNWERCLAATTGQWVSVIGDDDLIDPDLIDALEIAIALKPGLEAFGWANLRYGWLDDGDPEHNVRLPLASSFHDMPPELVRRRAFRWDDAGATITSGFSVYHSALSRPLLERMRMRFGGRYFGHPVVDYDSAIKAAALGNSFIYCQRPFSIFGACKESNSAALYSLERLRDMNARFFEETGRTTDGDPWMRGFPFPSTLGLPAAVLQVQQWLAHQHGVPMLPGWEANFAAACARNCNFFSEREEFELAAANYRLAFSAWRGGAHLGAFRPEFKPVPKGQIFTGLIDTSLYVSDRIGGATSPATFWRAANALLERPENLARELRSAGRENSVLATIAPERRIA